MRSAIAPYAVALLCGAFVLGGLADDAAAKRKRRSRKSRAVKKAEAERKKAEEERLKAEEERKKAEEERKKAEQAAADARAQAAEAKKQLEQIKSGAVVGPKPAKPEYNADNPLWGGFFMSLNLGYSTSGGTDGPLIPDPENVIINGGFAAWQAKGCMFPAQGQVCYPKFITTDRGAGLAAAIQIGYNIKGYVSLWADLHWHGSFGDKTDMAGAGAGAFMLGVHPLRFWRPDAPVDVRVYGGFGFFEVLYYYEKEGKAEAEGKSWTGTTIPFGVSTEVALGDVFSIGLDLRFVRAAYDRWIYNWDKDQVSVVVPAETTFRFEPRLMFGWHF